MFDSVINKYESEKASSNTPTGTNTETDTNTGTGTGTGTTTSTANNIIIKNITINNNVSKFIPKKDISNYFLVSSFKLYTEKFNYPITEDYKLLNPIRKKINDSTLLFKFNKNTKIDSIKYLLNNNAIYKFYAKNIFNNNWKLINRIHIQNNNKSVFLNKDMIINDNIISSEYKLELTNSLYYISPINFIERSGTKNKIKNDDMVDTNYLRYISWDSTKSEVNQINPEETNPSTIWVFEDNGVDSNNNLIYKIYAANNNNNELYSNYANYILKKT